MNSIKSTLAPLLFISAGILIFFISSVVSFPPLPRVVVGTLYCCLFFLLSMLFLRFDQFDLTTMRLVPDTRTPIRLLMGFVIGVGIAGTMLIALFSFTNLDLTLNDSQQLHLFMLAALVYIPLALMEELLFRGYPFFRMAKSLNIRVVIFITALLFGLYHYNDSTTISAVLLGPGVWGVVFGVAAYLSNSVAVPLGIHFAANFMQAVFDLKEQVSPLWTITGTVESSASGMAADTLGVAMQIILLIVTIIVFEMTVKSTVHDREND